MLKNLGDLIRASVRPGIVWMLTGTLCVSVLAAVVGATSLETMKEAAAIVGTPAGLAYAFYFKAREAQKQG